MPRQIYFTDNYDIWQKSNKDVVASLVTDKHLRTELTFSEIGGELKIFFVNSGTVIQITEDSITIGTIDDCGLGVKPHLLKYGIGQDSLNKQP